jgi:membrane-bound lytic murein transglycosylase B
MGQTQFLPSSYLKYGIDYDKDGYVNLRRSVPDILASTANFLKANGWRANEPFDEGTGNFEVMRFWNQALLYRKAIVQLAERIGKP